MTLQRVVGVRTSPHTLGARMWAVWEPVCLASPSAVLGWTGTAAAQESAGAHCVHVWPGGHAGSHCSGLGMDSGFCFALGS